MNELATQPAAGGTVALVRGQADRLAAALPQHFTPEKMAQVMSLLEYRNPKLRQCDPESLITSLIQVGTLDLDLTPGMNEAHLIPRKVFDRGRDTGRLECTVQIGFKGLEKLAVRCGAVRRIEPRDVREADSFRVRHVNGSTLIEHEPAYRTNAQGEIVDRRGQITHVYTVAKMADGDSTIEVMTAEEVENVHRRSESYKNTERYGKPETGPWATDWKEMALKTCVKRHCKRLPRPSGPEAADAFQRLQAAIDLDNQEYQTEALPAPRIDNASGSKSGQYASDEQRSTYLDKLREWLRKKNAEWVDRWTDAQGECPLPPHKEFINVYQADGHLLKWAVETGRLDPKIVPENVKIRQLGGYVAIVYHRSRSERIALGREMEAYAEAQAVRQAEALLKKHPELAERFGEPEDASQEHQEAFGQADPQAAEGDERDADPDDVDYPDDGWDAGSQG